MPAKATSHQPRGNPKLWSRRMMPERLTDCQILKIASCNATRWHSRQPPLASQVLEEGSSSLTILFLKWRLALFAKPANEVVRFIEQSPARLALRSCGFTQDEDSGISGRLRVMTWTLGPHYTSTFTFNRTVSDVSWERRDSHEVTTASSWRIWSWP